MPKKTDYTKEPFKSLIDWANKLCGTHYKYTLVGFRLAYRVRMRSQPAINDGGAVRKIMEICNA